MILCDSPVWLALAISNHTHHDSAQSWIETIDRPASIFFCRATQQSFLRLLTTAAVMAPYGSPPLTNFEAWTVYESLLADYRVDFHYREPPGVERLWREFAVRDTASVKLWMDAYLAAFAHSGGYQMVTTDRAFSQFASLDLVLLSASNP